MKIAIDARVISTGTGRYIERLLHYLEKIDHEHEFLILVRKKDLTYYVPKNPKFRIVEADFADYSFDEQLSFGRLLRKLKPDLVHFCMPQQPLLYVGKTITTVHDLNLLRITANDDMSWLELRLKKLIFAGLLWRVAHRSSRILTPSQYTKDDLVRFSHIAPSKVTVTHEAADPLTVQPKPIPALIGQEFLLYVGRAEPYKNNRGLIEAHQQVLSQFPQLQLVIVGNKDILREADMQWVEQKQYKNIHFLGFVSDAELAWLYTQSAAYVFPSFMEGFGLPGLEAMATGTPVVSSNTTCLPEIYQDGAIYFNPHNTGDMAAAIRRVIGDSELQQTLASKGRKIAATYSWQRMAEQTLYAYNQIEQK